LEALRDSGAGGSEPRPLPPGEPGAPELARERPPPRTTASVFARRSGRAACGPRSTASVSAPDAAAKAAGGVDSFLQSLQVFVGDLV
jgi:hypothetical protein